MNENAGTCRRANAIDTFTREASPAAHVGAATPRMLGTPKELVAVLSQAMAKAFKDPGL